MTRVLHRRRADEALIPVATARPAPVAPSAPLPPKRAHADEVLRDLRAADTSWSALGMRQPVAPKPIVLTDWSARLAADWVGIGVKLDNLSVTMAEPLVKALIDTDCNYANGVHSLADPLLAELVELRAVSLVNWRQALRVHTEDELALIDAEMAVAL